MKITFLGGADEVGASSTLLEVGDKRLLVDCGIRPNPKNHAGLAGDQLPDLSRIDALGGLDAILVTHAHTDHTGALELVCERFPDIPVYATAPTIALTRVLHQDARRIMQSRLDEEGELPLFDDLAVQRLLAAFTPVPYRTRLALADDLAVTFFPAGHIAGAAMLGLETPEGNLLFTGDFSISPQRTVDGARPPAFQPDLVITESTYGGRLHANRAAQERQLIETVAGVIAEGGKVLIPAFALGRAQEILLILAEAQRRADLPPAPVWADGMVRAVCQAYTSFPEFLPLTLQESGAQFFSGVIQSVQSRQQRQDLIWQPGPAVIVASSGMLAGGPSQEYARALTGSRQHAILLTGYQDEESPGRRLQQAAERGGGSIRLGESKVEVQCRLATYSLSAHADEAQMVSLMETLGPTHVALVHGDGGARSSLEKALAARGRVVHLPYAGKTLEFNFGRGLRPVRPGQSGPELRHRQAELARRRREQMAEYTDVVGQWLLLQGNPPTPARCLSLAEDHLWVETAPGLGQAVYPEDILQRLGETPPDTASAGPVASAPALLLQSVPPAPLEPNRAMQAAQRAFPPAARLRKAGYRLESLTLVLTFDFPLTAPRLYAAEIEALTQTTGWQVEIYPETNQAALTERLRSLLPSEWALQKGPAIYRQEQRLAANLTGLPQHGSLEDLQARFQAETGYQLELTLLPPPSAPVILPVAFAGERLEINAAYTFIKNALQGSSLYRVSLKDSEIWLSFISPQVGGRYQQEIADLGQQTGWPLRLNPQANQAALAETAARLMADAGLTIAKGPSLHLERAEVQVTLAQTPGEEEWQRLVQDFAEQTGWQLLLLAPAAPAAPSGNPAPKSVAVPLRLIRPARHLQELNLDPLKLEKAVERARRLGVSPPVTLRRARDYYILTDGLYRLRAAEALGLENIPAVIEA